MCNSNRYLLFTACRTLIAEKNHAVLITAVTLVTEMCEKSPDTYNYFRKVSISYNKFFSVSALLFDRVILALK